VSPWPLLTALLALINLAAFVALRGRWDRLVPLLAVAALLGAVGGDAVGGATALEPLPLGDFHPVAASIGAQLLMLAVVLLAGLAPARKRE
jgi:hypothetical protein